MSEPASIPSRVEPPAPPAPVSQPVEAEEPPPFLGSWRNVYLFVVGELAVMVMLFYALSRWAS